MAREHILGETVKYMMENGKMDRKKVMEYGEEFMVIAISVSGSIIKQKAMEFTHG